MGNQMASMKGSRKPGTKPDKDRKSVKSGERDSETGGAGSDSAKVADSNDNDEVS